MERVTLSSALRGLLSASLPTCACVRVSGFVCVLELQRISEGCLITRPGTPWSVARLEAGVGPQGLWLPSDSGSVANTLALHFTTIN